MVSVSARNNLDDWLRIPKNPARFFDNQLLESQFSEVDKSMRQTALVMLERMPFVGITSADAKKFSNGRLDPRADSNVRFYLVRAVRLIEGGKFSVFQYGSSIYVIYGDLGLPRATMRSAVVVAVDGEITQVFATCSTAE